jgi:chromosome segregation ATPase
VLAKTGACREQDREDADARLTAWWCEGALNAEDGLKTALGEVRTQRDRIGELLERIRDLEQDLPQNAVQRVTTESTTLKRQIQQLTGERSGLEDRLSLPSC